MEAEELHEAGVAAEPTEYFCFLPPVLGFLLLIFTAVYSPFVLIVHCAGDLHS